MKKLISSIALAALLAGCATPAAVEQMSSTVGALQTNPALKNSIGVQDVTGGKETNPAWTSQVSSDSFRRALELSLESSGMLSKIAAGGKYQLTADLNKLDQPLMGLDMTVTSTVRYSLLDSQSRKEIYGRVIQMPYTASMSDAFVGSQRLKLANEGSIRANIEAFIRDMQMLKLP